MQEKFEEWYEKHHETFNGMFNSSEINNCLYASITVQRRWLAFQAGCLSVTAFESQAKCACDERYESLLEKYDLIKSKLNQLLNDIE
jgi:hypothetical protein